MTPLERAARAAEAAVFNPAGGYSVSIRGDIEVFYANIARAVLTAIREPNEAMKRAAEEREAIFPIGEPFDQWFIMIDALLAEEG